VFISIIIPFMIQFLPPAFYRLENVRNTFVNLYYSKFYQAYTFNERKNACPFWYKETLKLSDQN
jgi:hypothetical protein